MSKQLLFRIDGAIGDILGSTAIFEVLKNTEELKDVEIIVSTNQQHFCLFENNPYIKQTIPIVNNGIFINPSRVWGENVSKNAIDQIFKDFKYTNDIKPKIYLSESEILNSKKLLSKYDGLKKVAVCLNSSASIRDIEYEKILPLLQNLKKDRYILLSISKYSSELYKHGSKIVFDYENMFDENFDKLSLREVFSIINECEFYLGVDTGLMQASAALNIPQFVFFTNNGCSNNSYDNTFFINSEIKCGDSCMTAPLASCQTYPYGERCMDKHNMDDYYKLIKEKFSGK